MSTNFVEIESESQLDGLFQASHERPVAILKHSNSCGISSHIHEMLSGLDVTINVVTVQVNRGLSNEIATRTGYTHQSPQVFVLRQGKPVYHATHYGIDPAKLAQAMQ